MLNSTEYRFPLLDEILTGSMCPFLLSNSFETFLLREESFVTINSEPDRGLYTIMFPKPLNLKCRFYHDRIVKETICYCNELISKLHEFNDADIISYLRLTVMDRHLKTALIKTGEVLRENKLKISDFTTPSPEVDNEKLSNSYIFHLLKVCLVKAYLEVQHQLGASQGKYMDEFGLYGSFTGDLPPFKCFLRKQKLKNTETKQQEVPKPEVKTTPPVSTDISKSNEKTYRIGELTEILHTTERTIRRWLEEGKLKGSKTGKLWFVTESDLKEFKEKNNLNNK